MAVTKKVGVEIQAVELLLGSVRQLLLLLLLLDRVRGLEEVSVKSGRSSSKRVWTLTVGEGRAARRGLPGIR
jgi:hypothetical protein